MAFELTTRQREMLYAIEVGTRLEGRPPSIPELMIALDVVSPNGIAKHLKALERKGYIARRSGARGIQILDIADDDKIIRLPTGTKPGSDSSLLPRSSSTGATNSPKHSIEKKTSSFENDRRDDAHSKISYVPLLGSIAAGNPIYAEENVEELISVDSSLTGDSSETFYLRVKGDSMIEEGIMSGDMVLIAKCDSVENGELAAVILNDEATIKRFYRKGNTVTLEPANPIYEPIIVDLKETECIIAGKVIGLTRSYKRKF